MDCDDNIVKICEACGGHFDLDEMTYGWCAECRDLFEELAEDLKPGGEA